jgi:hypothetical protein
MSRSRQSGGFTALGRSSAFRRDMMLATTGEDLTMRALPGKICLKTRTFRAPERLTR